jgi:hypothetical protein
MASKNELVLINKTFPVKDSSVRDIFYYKKDYFE